MAGSATRHLDAASADRSNAALGRLAGIAAATERHCLRITFMLTKRL